jgi:hypothetical protein
MSEPQLPASNEAQPSLPHLESDRSVDKGTVREIEGYRTEVLQHLEDWPWIDR